MAIHTKQSFKVYEQSTTGDGCGTVLANFTEAKGGESAAMAEATRLARDNPGTRYYVLRMVAGVYQAGNGEIQGSAYTT